MQNYNDFGDFLKKHFSGKVQKISINAGLTCPNRDGSKGIGGCTYCNNNTFNPAYCKPTKSVAEQLQEGKAFFARKYPTMKYLAYFQAYTNTYGEIEHLKELYEEALAVDDVVGIIIGTRPDCIPNELLNYLAQLAQNRFVFIEYGAETANNTTLATINRGHTWQDTADAVHRTTAHGLECGLHLILGLPGEKEDDILNTIKEASTLPITTLKQHQLQLIRGTKLAAQVQSGELSIIKFTPQAYIELCGEIIKHTRQDIYIARFVSQSPADLLISPKWGLKNNEFTNLLNNYLKATRTTQGSEY